VDDVAHRARRRADDYPDRSADQAHAEQTTLRAAVISVVVNSHIYILHEDACCGSSWAGRHRPPRRA
jgi:hypothetical protein